MPDTALSLHDAAALPEGFEFFSLPPEQAIQYFRRLGIEITDDYRDLWSKEQRRAFTVAKLTQLDLLEKVHDLIDGAIADGMSLAEFQEHANEALSAAGWGGKLGSSRLENIYRTNLASAYAAGDHEQMQEAALERAQRGEVTYLEFNAVGDERTRPAHEDRDGTVLPIDDPWWDENTPPLDYECRCWPTEHTERTLDRYGLKQTERPDIPSVAYRNPKTGEELTAPRGVQPGFGRRNWDTAVGDELRRRLAAAPRDLRRAVKAGIEKGQVQ